MSDPNGSDEMLTDVELNELLEESQLKASPEQLRAILAFIEESGGIEEAQLLLEQLRKVA